MPPRRRATPAVDEVALLVRYAGETDHVACTLSNGEARIDEVVAGARRTLARGASSARAGRAVRASVAVRDRSVSLLIDGTTIARATLSPAAPRRGGVGFAVWDADRGVADATLQHVSIRSATMPGTAAHRARTPAPQAPYEGRPGPR